jgi:hypothetical protein
MTDDGNGGNGGHGYALNRNLLNNVVLRSSYASSGLGRLMTWVNSSRMLTCAVICISETWFKRCHTNKQIGIPGYKVVRSDRRDGRRSGGVAVYIKDQYKYKILSKSPDSCIIDYIFIELKFHGEDILIGLVYNPTGVPGLPVYQPILEDLFPRYSHGNTNLLVNCALELKHVFESVSLSIISKEPTNFSSASPTLIDIWAYPFENFKMSFFRNEANLRFLYFSHIMNIQTFKKT